jgi:CheY-like chemotaxis protein
MLDVNLGGTMGYKVAESLQQRNIPFFFATGYDRTSLPEQLRNVPLVTKPYTIAQLTRTLRAALAREDVAM